MCLVNLLPPICVGFTSNFSRPTERSNYSKRAWHYLSFKRHHFTVIVMVGHCSLGEVMHTYFSSRSKLVLHTVDEDAITGMWSFDVSAAVCISQGSCAGFEFKASLEKSLNFRKLKKALNCFGKRVEGLEKFGICLL